MNNAEMMQGYGSDERQQPEISEENALNFIGTLSEDDFKTLENILLEDLEPQGIHSGAGEGHVRQVHAIGMMLAKESGDFESPEQQRLVSLVILLHDIKKQPGNFIDLFTHAHKSADAIPDYLEHLKEETPTTNNVSTSLREKLASDEGRKMSLYLAKVIETHSSIPFIDSAFNYQQLQEIYKQNGSEALPYLEERVTDTGENYYGLPTPKDKYGNLLRAADTLSNYGLFPDMEMPLWERADDKLAKYSGFLKIVKLNKPMPLPEEMDTLYNNEIEAIQSGIYDEIPNARELAQISAERTKWLGDYFKENSFQILIDKDTSEFINSNDLETTRASRAKQLAAIDKASPEHKILADKLALIETEWRELFIKAFTKMSEVDFTHEAVHN